MNPTQKNADAVFSKYIRLKNATPQGYIQCYTCGIIKHYKNMDCGHFIKREYHRLRYDERNCKPQCTRCNHYNSGMQDEFAKNIIDEYGIEVFNELMNKKHLPYTEYLKGLYASVIETYQPKVKKLLERII